MASRMTWPLVALGSCAVVALLSFGTRPAVEKDMGEPVLDENGNQRHDHPLAQRYWVLEDELSAAQAVLYEQAAFDSGYARVPVEPGLVVRRLPEPVRPDGQDEWAARGVAFRDSVERAFRSAIERQLGGNASRARVALVEVRMPVDTGVSYLWYGEMHPDRYFAAREQHGGFCFGTFTSALSVMQYEQPLGPCRLWARYGEPSPEVLGWLARSGHVLEFDSVLTDMESHGWGPYGFVYAAERTPRRQLFGMRAYDETIDYVGLDVQACLSGREGACLAAALDAEAWRFRRARYSGTALQSRLRYSALGTIGGLFGALERELGSEEFARIWRTSRDPRGDIEAALGADLDDWIRDWLRDELGVEPVGPRVPPGTGLLSFLAIGGLALAGVVVTARRQLR